MRGEQLPTRPRLRPYLRTLVLDQDRMLVKGGTSTVLLRGSSVEDVASTLLPSLDGARTVDEIVAAFDWIEPNVVVEAIGLFNANGLLEDAAAEPPAILDGEIGRYGHQTTYWLSISGDRYGFQEKLADTSTVIFGLGGVGSALAISLATAGVGRLVLIDSEQIEPADALFGYASHCMGQPRAWAMKMRLKEANGTVVADIPETPAKQPAAVAAELEGSDLGIFCSDSSSTSGSDAASIAVCEALNNASLELGIPWTRAAVDHHHGVVGPSVIPRETACFTCFRLRLRSNLSYHEDALAYERHLAEPNSTVLPAILGPFATLVGQYAAIEAIKLLTNFANPATAGAFIALNGLTGGSTRHDVLKLPRCPACGPTRDRPQMKIWDTRDPQ